MPSNSTMRACVLTECPTLAVREVPRPEVGPHDVLVRVSSVGLCATDFHIFEGHANYNTDGHGRPIPLADHPQILGHEISGVIEERAPEVRHIQGGERVSPDQVLNGRSARRAPVCEYCASGDSHQ